MNACKQISNTHVTWAIARWNGAHTFSKLNKNIKSAHSFLRPAARGPARHWPLFVPHGPCGYGLQSWGRRACFLCDQSRAQPNHALPPSSSSHRAATRHSRRRDDTSNSRVQAHPPLPSPTPCAAACRPPAPAPSSGLQTRPRLATATGLAPTPPLGRSPHAAFSRPRPPAAAPPYAAGRRPSLLLQSSCSPGPDAPHSPTGDRSTAHPRPQAPPRLPASPARPPGRRPGLILRFSSGVELLHRGELGVMANSEYEYVKREFEFDRRLPPSNWIVVRIDGCHFHRFSKIHAFEKPNDENALRLMNACATCMLEKFPDIVFAYGVSDEYSFVFREETEFYQRRESKILSLCVSYFTSVYVMKWKDFFPNKELREPPYFDGRVVCYPNLKTMRDYLAWRQVDCHINNQYNTCFWMLVKSGKTEKEAQQILKGTFSKDKNELLSLQFQTNYDDEPAIFRKGSCVYREKVEINVKTDDYGNPIKRMRLVVKVANVDIIGPEFWEDHQYILQEDKCKFEYVKKSDSAIRLPPCNWTVFCINGCQFDQFSLIHSFEKPNDETALRLMNASASLMMERFPDIIFGYGFSSEYSFVFQEKTELYQRQESLILSSCSSYFTSLYMMKWKEFFPNKELRQPPHFEAKVLCYPKSKVVCDYLSWRQAECHNGNQYNTCFWMLVKSGKSESEAHEILKGTLSKDKNELLFQQFKMNYNNEPAMFRKGSCIYQQKMEDSGNVTRERWDMAVAHVDMGPEFWRKHHYIFNK